MGGLNVKNTMIERLLSVLAPHLCFGCGILGPILCQDCKYNITHDPFAGCFVCGLPSLNGVCEWHKSPIKTSFIAASYDGAVKKTIKALKFNHMRSSAPVLAELLHSRLPVLPEGAVLLAVPTVRSHVRERGYDQAELITAHLAKLRSAPVVKLVKRKTNKTQHTAGRDDRIKQAKAAFSLLPGGYSGKGPIVIVDDVVTTGATAEALARTLAPLGVPVWLAAVSYKPLD